MSVPSSNTLARHETNSAKPPAALRRLRRTSALRALRREVRLHPCDLVAPLFVAERDEDAEDVPSLPGVTRHTVATLRSAVDALVACGVRGALVFGISAFKDSRGSAAWKDDGIVPRAVDAIRSHLSPDQFAIFTDVCLCQYTSHGQCGVVGDDGVLNDASAELAARIAVAHAAAGADVVAPSGMLDGGVAAIRAGLESAGYGDVGIMAYAAKYASALYGPFRDAVHAGNRTIDRRRQQLDPHNALEGVLEARQDLAEGADVLMVKPAGPYLDVLSRLRAALPDAVLAGYQVSGEHAMLAAAAERGWIDLRAATLESLVAIKRAGANIVITYAAARAARWLADDDARRGEQ